MIAALSLTLVLAAIPSISISPMNAAISFAAYEDADLAAGRKAFSNDEYQKAVGILKPYVERKKKSYEGYLYLGLSYRGLERFDEAIAALEKAVEIKPKLPQAHIELGKTYLAAKRFDAGVKEYEWLRHKDVWLVAELRLAFPDDVAKQYHLPPSPLALQQADLEGAKPIFPASLELRPTILYKEKATYREEARDNKVQGTVILKIVFSKQGKPIIVGILRGLPYGLTESAIEAASKIRFTPAMKDGQPVSVRANIEFNFSLY